MARRIYTRKNYRPFTALCDCRFGRQIIYTQAANITSENILRELGNALDVHALNASQIEYLNSYYCGDQPILYRRKEVRPEVNNRVVMNLAYELVERKVADICAEPIQYVLRGADPEKADEVSALNKLMDGENKQEVDIEICRWRSICGTAYRFITVDNNYPKNRLLDESEFELTAEDPRYCFVVYYPNKKAAFSCQIRENENGGTVYFCYTNSELFVISNGEIIQRSANGNGAIPVIEYPNNERRLSDIEITISITDAINTLQSDRINGVEQFVSSWIKFVNCDIDETTFKKMRDNGALVVKSNNGENKADVDVMSNELNQTEGQVMFNDLFDKFLSIQGLASRQGNTGGDTQGAVNLRNGHYDAGLRTAINEPILKKAENEALRIILNRLHITQGYTLMPSDVDIHINHNKLDNMLVKAETLKLLLDSGIDYPIAIKSVDFFSDPEQVAAQSRERMEMLYPKEQEQQEVLGNG